MNDHIDLLFTLDEGYLEPLKVALVSIAYNSPESTFRIWLVHECIAQEKLTELNKLVISLGWEFSPLVAEGSIWDDAPTEKRYPKEMYFRLLAGEILPSTVKKVIYLDPDVLVINPLLMLWNLDLEGNMLAAASHVRVVDVTTPINKLRLNTDHAYYNSGVLVIDLELARNLIQWSDIKKTIVEYGEFLMLPDQDILNHLYGKYVLEIPDAIWNYDARNYATYVTKSLGKKDIQWVMQHTSILHFNGKPKPWEENHSNRFTALYLNYQKLMKQMEEGV